MTGLPRLRHEWAYLAAVAQDIHAKRAASYPARVGDGRMTSAEADAALSAIAAIAADWRAAADGGVPADGPGRVGRAARIATLTTARDRATVLADKAATALRAQLPPRAALPDRDPLVIAYHDGQPMSAAAERWVRALDYAAAIAAMLWWEQGAGACRLRVVCGINAALHAGRAAAAPPIAAAA